MNVNLGINSSFDNSHNKTRKLPSHEIRTSELIKEFLLTQNDSNNETLASINASDIDVSHSAVDHDDMESIHRRTTELIKLLLSYDEQTNLLLDRLKSTSSRVSTVQQHMKKYNIIQKLQHYIYRKNVYKLLQLSMSLKELNQICTDNQLIRVPDLVMKIVQDDSAATMIPNNSQIKTLLITSVTKIRKQQLLYFQQDFENHLIYESSSSATATESTSTASHHNHTSAQTTNSWESFLNKSKLWLLSYTSVSLLPVILTESKSLLPERYIEYLDEALTPLWGRFHFHLNINKDSIQSSLLNINHYTSTNTNTNISSTSTSASSLSLLTLYNNHLLWIFNYSKNFIHLISGFCTEMITSNKLSFLDTFFNTASNNSNNTDKDKDNNNSNITNTDIATLIRSYVVDKAIRFMRAHVANVVMIVLSSSSTPTTTNSNSNSNSISSSNNNILLLNQCVIALVNEIFSLDHYFNSQLIAVNDRDSPDNNNDSSSHNTNKSATVPTNTNTLWISPIIYDAKAFYYKWLLYEYTNYTAMMKSFVVDVDPRDLFICKFGVSTTASITAAGRVVSDVSSESNQFSYRCCYKSVYQCMKMFILATQRYQVSSYLVVAFI